MSMLLLLFACARAPAEPPTTPAPDACELCQQVYRAGVRRDFCRTLEDPQAQERCVQIEESLVWWGENEVYWLGYGCQTEAGWQTPCPAREVCGWVEYQSRGHYCETDQTPPTRQECADACTHARMAEAIDGSRIEAECRSHCGLDAALPGLP